MKITKYGHCCFLVEERGLRILFDPGIYSSGQEAVRDLDILLITHSHTDHFDVQYFQRIVANNPKATVITNSEVGKELEKNSYAIYNSRKWGQNTRKRAHN